MASKSRAMLLLLLLSAMAVAASAGVYTVGGASGPGWSFGSQSSPPALQPGDELRFTYREGAHNVVQVSEQDYNSCSVTNSWNTYTSGDDYITLPSQGSYYFICSLPEHCSAGMKLAVYVN